MEKELCKCKNPWPDVHEKYCTDCLLLLEESNEDRLIDFPPFVLTSDRMPNRNEYVLIKTPYCKFPATVAFWNGAEWRDNENNAEYLNVTEWLSLKSLSSTCS